MYSATRLDETRLYARSNNVSYKGYEYCGEDARP